MKNWFTSLNGAITLSLISLLIFLGRTFIDFYYVYDEFSLDTPMMGLVILLNMALFGGWIWGLMSAVKGSRRGLMASLGFDLFFLIVVSAGTLITYCPSPCPTGWPLAEIASWASLVIGLLAAIALGFQFRSGSLQLSLEGKYD